MSADIDALAWQPTVRCGLEFDFLDVVVAADGTPYASLVDGCTAEERHSRPGQGIVGHLVSGPPLVGTAGELTTACHAAAALPAAAANPAAAATAWSVVSARIYVNGRRVRTVRGRRLRAPSSSSAFHAAGSGS